MILMPGCNCCAGCAESITVTLTDLPNENRVDVPPYANPEGYIGDNYMTSNEGSFTLTKTSDYVDSGRFGDFQVCIYEYEDGLSSSVPSLKIKVTLTNYFEAATPYWTARVDLNADAGLLAWERNAASSPLPTTFTNSDVVANNSGEWTLYYSYYVPVPWTLQPSMSVAIQAATGSSLGQCNSPSCNFFPATTGTCNQIMTVTDATNRPAYCGENPTIYSVAPDSSAPNNTLTFVNAGTDTLDLTLPNWVGTQGAGGTRTVQFNGATHSLGWGGSGCVDLMYAVDSVNLATAYCGTQNGYLPVNRQGWTGAFNVTLTDDFTAGGGGIINYQCTALASVTLSRRYWSAYATVSNAPSRRIQLEIALFWYAGYEPTGNYLTMLLNTRVAFSSDGTIGEDAYTYGNFPTCTQANSAGPVVVCPFDLYGTTWTSTPFTIAQG
jgi:hypothetical protein